MKPPPDVEFTAAMAVADRAMRSVLGDRQVWADESGRTGAAPLSWPPTITMAQGVKGNHAGLLAAMAGAAVQTVLESMLEADAGHPPPEDPRRRAQLRDIVQHLDAADPEVQIILRVVERAITAASAALCAGFGGPRAPRRLTGKREFVNWMKAREVDAAVRSGIPRAEALAALGFGKSSAYRAMRRR